MKKPAGWLPTRPSRQQIFMLDMFAHGWKFRLYNKKPGSWNTYWALRRRGLVHSRDADNELTQKGRDVLAYYGNKP